jgi:hypothetical protein
LEDESIVDGEALRVGVGEYSNAVASGVRKPEVRMSVSVKKGGRVK